MAEAKAILKDGTLLLSGTWDRNHPHPTPAAFLAENASDTPDTPALQALNADALESWDSTLLVFLSALLAATEKTGVPAPNLESLPKGLRTLLELGAKGRRNAPAPRTSGTEEPSLLHRYGTRGLELWGIFLEIVRFVGEVSLGIWRLITFRSSMRACDFRAQLVECGPRALGIISLISFLMGLVLAFVGSIPLKWFQAQPYVASLVGIGMLRLMTPTMVGVVMAGRNSAAYAAELGTMKVNEELDALQTLGIPLVDFLVMPRFLAMCLMMPLLTLFGDLVSIFGGMLVAVFDLDLTVQSYWTTLVTTTRVSDLLVGVVTCAILGILDALCGCYQGMHCGNSAAAVGESTTSAVVYSIVCIVIATSLVTIITVLLKI